MTMALKAMSVVICGSGNGSHTMAGIASTEETASVNVVTVNQDKAERWTAAMEENGFCVRFGNEELLKQEPGKVRFGVCKDNAKVVSQADVLVIIVPAHVHDIYLRAVVPHLSDKCLIVAMPGLPGFEYQCLHYLNKYGKKCPIMSTETLPWACRIVNFGQIAEVLGTKEEMEVSLTFHLGRPNTEKNFLQIIQRLIGPKPLVKKASHQLQLTLAPNANFHPPIMYAKWQNWNGQEIQKPPLFYHGVTEESVKYIEAVADEVFDIAKEVTRRFPAHDFSRGTTVYEWLVDTYRGQIKDKTTLTSALQTNTAYEGLAHPMKKTENGRYVPDFSHRYIIEDVPYRLVVLRAIADMVNVKTPVIDEIIVWAQRKLGREFIVDGQLCQGDSMHTRIPQSYGINSLKELMNIFK